MTEVRLLHTLEKALGPERFVHAKLTIDKMMATQGDSLITENEVVIIYARSSVNGCRKFIEKRIREAHILLDFIEGNERFPLVSRKPCGPVIEEAGISFKFYEPLGRL